jgi:hypothetical protein
MSQVRGGRPSSEKRDSNDGVRPGERLTRSGMGARELVGARVWRVKGRVEELEVNLDSIDANHAIRGIGVGKIVLKSGEGVISGGRSHVKIVSLLLRLEVY